ncbi:MAG TPA: hypothetical protein VFC95_00255 [Guyparkeria sp.]|nr:hypothetical protein [Guyparkeria sp.]
MRVALTTHPDCELHENSSVAGIRRPENLSRLAAIQNQPIAQDVEPWLLLLSAPLAEVEDLRLAHSTAYVDSVLERAGQWHAPP